MKALKKKKYYKLLAPLQLELNQLAHWLKHTQRRLVVLFEGRDTAGKGGAINAVAERLNPRQVHVVSLPKPTERERTQWYFQRYITALPAAGEIALFDRSWYNRAGVEHVMGYCTRAEYDRFLAQAPLFEKMLVDDGVLLFKYWLSVDQQYQEERFAERVADPFKRWKLSPIDLEARTRYTEYGRAREAMFKATHTPSAPWYVVTFDDQRRGRLNLIRHLLDHVPDTRVPDEAMEMAPLAGKPAKEQFSGKVKPIRDAF